MCGFLKFLWASGCGYFFVAAFFWFHFEGEGFMIFLVSQFPFVPAWRMNSGAKMASSTCVADAGACGTGSSNAETAAAALAWAVDTSEPATTEL